MAAHQAPPSLGFSRQEHWSGLPFPSPMRESEKWKWSRSVVSDPQRSHGLQPTRLLHPWGFPGNSTWVGCHCLLRIIHNGKLKQPPQQNWHSLRKTTIRHLIETRQNVVSTTIQNYLMYEETRPCITSSQEKRQSMEVDTSIIQLMQSAKILKQRATLNDIKGKCP